MHFFSSYRENQYRENQVIRGRVFKIKFPLRWHSRIPFSRLTGIALVATAGEDTDTGVKYSFEVKKGGI